LVELILGSKGGNASTLVISGESFFNISMTLPLER